MRRLLYLTTLTMLAMLVFASAAMAQQDLESFQVPTARTSNVCPEPFTSTFDPDNPETAETFTCLSPQDLAASQGGTPPEDVPVFGAADGICVGPGEGDPDCAEALRQGLIDSGQLAPDAPPSPEVAPVVAPTGEALPSESLTVMPDTGGPSFLLPVAALLVGSGILGFAALRRRS